MQEEKKISIPLLVGGLVLVIIIGAGGILIAINQSNTPANKTTGQQLESTNQTNTVSNSTTNTPTSTTASYKDGTYQSTGSYISPNGDESIGVSLTIAHDTVTAVKVTPNATDSESQLYESRFASGISSVVVGKKLDSVSVTRVNGSSLTGTGFNAALARIKTQARV